MISTERVRSPKRASLLNPDWRLELEEEDDANFLNIDSMTSFRRLCVDCMVNQGFLHTGLAMMHAAEIFHGFETYQH
jgi:hypothetical protein